ncbi:MAG: nitrous oxide reductase family maturation protein NosD, partial [Chloroflexota bacterium]
QARRRFLGRWLDRDEGARRRADDHDHPPDQPGRTRFMLGTTGLVAALAVFALTVNIVGTQPTQAPAACSGTTGVVPADGSGEFSSISEAVAAAVGGDTILVQPGTYSESIVIDKDITLMGGGDRDQTIIEAPAGGDVWDVGATGFVGMGTAVIPYAILLDDAGGQVSGLTLRGEASALIGSGGEVVFEDLVLDGAPLAITHGAEALVRSNELRGESSWIRVFEDSVATIDGNSLSQGAALVVLMDADGTDVRNNVLEGAGVFIQGSPSVKVEGNVIVEPGAAGISISNRVGEDKDPQPVAVRNNSVTGASQAGIDIKGLIRGTITGNELVDNRLGISLSLNADIAEIEGNSIRGGTAGIVIGAGSPIVVGNTVEGARTGLTIGTGFSPTLSANVLCGNERDLVVGSDASPVIDDTNEICVTDWPVGE